MKCLVVVNSKSGGFRRMSRAKIERAIGRDYTFEYMDIDDDFVTPIADGKVGVLAVCGGDGTLNSVINAVEDYDVEIMFVPCGTLNEKSKIQQYEKATADNDGKMLVGRAGKIIFTYVAACGSFTPIGYTAKVVNKKKYKIFAYLAEAIKEYRIHNIHAEINIDGKNYNGTYTLIMVIKSPRCFGFRFNRLYDDQKETGHILLIKSPGKNNLLGKIKMFFPFFRAFFLGFDREVEGRNIIFKEFTSADIKTSAAIPYDVDGEKRILKGINHFCVERLRPSLTICSKKSNQ